MTRLASLSRVLPALLGLCGCDIPLPSGAYTPENVDVVRGVGDAGRGDAMAVVPPTPGGGTTGGNAGMGGTVGGMGGGDASSGNPDEARLNALAGLYYMRMDLFSTATVQALPAVKLVTRNRISYLLVTELYVEGGQLKASERLCHQTFMHACEEGCSTLKTSMRPEVTDKLVVQPVSQRSYTLASSDLTGNTLRMDLGYDFTSNATLPTSASDARVWDIVTTNSGRDGMMAHIDSTGFFAVSCDVYSVQSFVSKLTGKVAGSATAPSLIGATFKLDTTGAATNSLGASNDKCTDKGGERPTMGDQTVRFALASDIDREALYACPDVSEWEKKLPATAP